MQIYAQNGVIPLMPGGVALLPADAAAPNGVEFAATVTLRTRGSGDARYATVDLPVGDYSAYSQLSVVWTAINAEGTVIRSSVRFSPAAGLNTIEGTEEQVFGRCAYLSIVGYEICAIDMSGRVGFSDGRHGVEGASDPQTPPAETVALGTPPAFTSDLVAGEAFTKSDGTVISATANTTVTITYDMADDASSTNLVEDIEVVDLTTPAGASEKFMRIKRVVGDPSLESDLTDYSSWTFVAAAAVDTALGVPPAFTSSLIEGIAFTIASGTVVNQGESTVTITYEQADDTAGTNIEALTPSDLTMPLTVRAVARIKRVLSGGTLSGDLTDYSAWTPVQNLPSLGTPPSFTSELTESAAFTIDLGTTADTTDDTSVTISFEDADDEEGTGIEVLPVTSLTMPASVNAKVRIKRVLSDPLLIAAGVGDLTDYSEWTDCADAEAAVPPQPVPTFGDTALGYAGSNNYFYPVVASFGDHESGDQYAWTTSLLSPIPDNQIEFMVTVAGGYRTQMDDPAARVDPNTQTTQGRTDYSVFRFTGPPYVLDEVKGSRIRFRRRRLVSPGVYGPWSEWTAQYECPAPTSDVSTDDWPKRWIPLIKRTRESYLAKQLDGPGLQFLRSFATTPAKPNLLLAAMDQNFQWESDDFGETFFTPSWNGQFSGRQGLSVWIDPEDWKRQISVYCSNPFDQSAAYLSTDGGQTCTKVLSLPQVRGTNSIRHNFQIVAHKPGGTPSTRTIFLIASFATAASANVSEIRLYRSTNGGATWEQRGSTLSAATYAISGSGPYELLYRPAGDLLIMCGPKGLFWSDNDGTSWTKATGLPAGRIHHLQTKANSEIWAATEGGLYKSANGKAYTHVSSFGTNEVRAFAISPADNNYIVSSKATLQNPWYTTNGGTTWSEGTTYPRLGQEPGKSHWIGSTDHYGIVAHLADRERWFFHGGQHFMVSTDHGQNCYHAGFLFDGRHSRGDVGFHPTDWLNIAFADQDTGFVVTQNGGNYFLEDNIAGKTSGPAAQIVAATGWDQYISGAGPMIHSSGRIIGSMGAATGNRVHCITDQNYDGNGSLGDVYVTDKVSGLSDNAAIDPNNANRGFIGQYRVTNLNAGSPSGVTFTQMAHQFVTLTGYGGQTVIYGCDKSNSDLKIYRSEDAGVSWTLWRTAQRSFRPVDVRPAFRACPHHAARVYAISGAGYLTRIVGTTNPTETTIFDARDYVSGAPSYKVHSVAIDPFNPDLGYLSLYMWGCPNVFRTQNLTAATPIWESIATDDADGLPHLDVELAVHPLTSDLIAISSHGTYVCAPPAGHRATYSIANSLWDRTNAYFKTVQ